MKYSQRRPTRLASIVVIAILAATCSANTDGGPSATTTSVLRSPTTSSASTTRAPSAPSTTSTIAVPTPPTTSSPNSEGCADPQVCIHPLVDKAVWDLPVLMIRFLPDGDSDGVIDSDTTGYSGTVAELRSTIEALETAGLWWMTESTRYRRDSGERVPSLGYRAVGEIEITSKVPLGDEVPWNDGWYRPDYRTILDESEVCRWVDEAGVREVWMWTQHYGQIEPAESNMWSPVGDISNSERTDDLPACGHSYTVYNYNFARGVAEMLHNHGHQAEALFGRGDADLFWDQFVGPRRDGGGLVEPIRCGWTHEPPNAAAEYDTHSGLRVSTDCLDWEPDGGTPAEVTCGNWFLSVYGDAECFDDGGLAFFVWWFQSFPGRENGLVYEGEPLANWWHLFADLEAVVDRTSWLLQPEGGF